ncbi:MAG: hypothetical protein ACYC3I_11195 [Gemmataceae bacterium]
MIRQYRVGLFACLNVLALVMAGCGPSRATVSGKVTMHGKPVTSGIVLFVSADNQIATGKLDDEGRYVAPRVPMGSVKVAVQTLRPEQVQAAVANRSKDAPPLSSRATNLLFVPKKYTDPETSELTCDVKQRQQEYNIDLP